MEGVQRRPRKGARFLSEGVKRVRRNVRISMGIVARGKVCRWAMKGVRRVRLIGHERETEKEGEGCKARWPTTRACRIPVAEKHIRLPTPALGNESSIKRRYQCDVSRFFDPEEHALNMMIPKSIGLALINWGRKCYLI